MAVDLSKYTKQTIGKLFDHSVLHKNATEEEIREGAQIAVKYNAAAYYTASGYWADVVKEELAGSDILLASGVDFPWGTNTIFMKATETEQLVKKGYQSVDAVINLGAVRGHKWDYVSQELKAFKDAAAGAKLSKVILEVCFLTDDEIKKAAELVAEAGIDYVKTSSGQFDGPSMEQYLVMRDAVAGSNTKTKVAGVKFPRPQNAYAFLMAGADLIGTRATPAIVDALDQMREIGMVPQYKG